MKASDQIQDMLSVHRAAVVGLSTIFLDMLRDLQPSGGQAPREDPDVARRILEHYRQKAAEGEDPDSIRAPVSRIKEIEATARAEGEMDAYGKSAQKVAAIEGAAVKGMVPVSEVRAEASRLRWHEAEAKGRARSGDNDEPITETKPAG